MTETIAPPAPLEYRAVTQIGGVSFPKRTIELIVMPYEDETVVEYNGRTVREIVSRGAFDGIEQRPNRVKVNRDHDTRMSCGKAIAFHPSREEGLVAELSISGTPLGDETLALAEDGVLDASAGFRVMPNGEVWETRDRRRLNKLWLGHIAMTPDPAYDGARVLAVRSQALPDPPRGIVRPNLAAALALRRQDEYDQL